MGEKTADRHKNRTSVTVKLTDVQTNLIQQSLPKQQTMTAKLRYLLREAVAIAQSQTGKRTEPEHLFYDEPNEPHSVRVSEELHDFIRSYGSQGEMDMTKQATSLVLVGLEKLLQASGIPVPQATKELKRLSKSSQKKHSRSDDLRHGLKLIWRAIWGR